jgi:uncharacterized protein YwqG
MERADIEKAFREAGLGTRVAAIDGLVRNSVRLLTTPIDEGKLHPGASKIGGHPDLPAGASWPRLKEVPQAFIAQIWLADVHAVAQSELPQQGMLWFFYDARQETFGEQPGDGAGWSVVFTDDAAVTLQRASTPEGLPAESLFQACALTLRPELTLALQPELEMPNFDWSEQEQAYEQVLEKLRDPADRALPHHRLLGNPDTIQDDMHMQCQLLSQGITDSADPRASGMEKDARDWQLLLQIDSDAGAKMRWASSGMLYYWLRQADVQARHFDRGWLILQSE